MLRRKDFITIEAVALIVTVISSYRIGDPDGGVLDLLALLICAPAAAFVALLQAHLYFRTNNRKLWRKLLH